MHASLDIPLNWKDTLNYLGYERVKAITKDVTNKPMSYRQHEANPFSNSPFFDFISLFDYGIQTTRTR